ncbi:MAG: hypothetical protein R3313_02050 [Candidatus Saccharimonadales bacterium]|nr:hypothetical protein [Candidatus Saccharimonadales bacterium]
MPPSEEELKQAAETLAKLKPGFLPLPIFLQTARLTVTSPVELVVLRKGKSGTEVYLTGRDSGDPFWPGLLHVPGTVVLSSDELGEDLEGPISRLVKDEFQGVEITDKPQLLMTKFRQSERGRELAHIYWVEGNGGVEKNWYPSSKVKSLKIFQGHIELIEETVKKLKEQS